MELFLLPVYSARAKNAPLREVRPTGMLIFSNKAVRHTVLPVTPAFELPITLQRLSNYTGSEIGM